MIAFLLPVLARIGVADRFRKAAAWVVIGALIVLFAIGLYAAFNRHIDNRVASEQVAIDATVTNRTLEAERGASANEMTRLERDAQNDKELSHEALRNDGTAVDSVLNRMREQQAAGRR